MTFAHYQPIKFTFFTGFGTVEDIGRLLFGEYLFAFEAASVLLVVAMIGAVVLARRGEP